MLLPYTTLTYYGPCAAAMVADPGVGEFEGTGHRTISPGITVVGTGTADVLRPYRGYAAAISTFGSSDMVWTPHKTLRFGLTVNVGAVPSAEDIAQAIWNATATKFNAPGSMGNKLNSASAAGDPWTADLSSYPPGSAGYTLSQVGETANGGLTLPQFIALR